MKKIMLILGCSVMVFTLISCAATYPVPVTATGNPVGTKVGKSSGKLVFFLWGNASCANIPDAARNGNITKISTVDMQVENFLGIVQTFTCVVTGE